MREKLEVLKNELSEAEKCVEELEAEVRKAKKAEFAAQFRFDREKNANLQVLMNIS